MEFVLDRARLFEFHSAHHEDGAFMAMHVDGEPVLLSSFGDEQNISTASLAPYAVGSPAADLLLDVVADSNFREQAEPYLHLDFGFWGFMIGILAVALALVFYMLQKHDSKVNANAAQQNTCATWAQSCQQACWNPDALACKDWVEVCFVFLPALWELEACWGMKSRCLAGYEVSCDTYDNLNCGMLLLNCPPPDGWPHNY